jgi:cation transport regulator
MPYTNIADLPKNVTHVLPTHAQEIYMKAFNNALKEYSDSSRNQDPRADTETIAHKVAWAAVGNVYEKNKNTGKWTKK